MPKLRLDRFLSNQTPLSRTDAIREIKRGNVTVDGVIQKQPSFCLETEKQTVMLSGVEIAYKEHIYLIMNKPKGVVCAARDKLSKTVLDIIPEKYRRKGLSTVGRLDKDTTGLLILTDDGDFAHKCISPKKMVPKKYIVTLDNSITDDDIAAFSDGITLADGTRCMPATLKRLNDREVAVTIFEGKYHQIKRMFGVRNLGVNTLSRVSIGLLNLPEKLAEGEVIEVNFDELAEKTINFSQN